MRVLFLAPDTHVYNHSFVAGLCRAGAQVHGIGPQPLQGLRPEVRALLSGYAHCPDLLRAESLLETVRSLPSRPTFDRVETIDEPLVEQAAILRERLQLPGLSPQTARLCRDKAAMKAFLRERSVPCAASAMAVSREDVLAFVDEHGLPVVLKPIAGFGSLMTFACRDPHELDLACRRLQPDPSRPIAVEEFIEGHEGFYDTIADANGVRFDFAAHYYPSCLVANRDRTIAPQIAVTNRIEQDGYKELRVLGARVLDALGLRGTATHMEWFFGPKGLKFSEIGARPAGEKIWDMHQRGNGFDLFAEWARAVLGQPAQSAPSRQYAVGSVQVRPDQDGRVLGHEGLREAWQRIQPFVYEHETPPPGAPTAPLDKGCLCNTWFRLRHHDYDQLRELMTFVGRTVRCRAR